MAQASRGMAQASRGRRQRRSTGRKQPSRSQATSLVERLTAAVPDSLAWALLFARWLLPAEGGAQGETLWLTSLTLFVAALICWSRSRTVWGSGATSDSPEITTGSRPVTAGRCGLSKSDFAALLLCGSHVVAALLVLINGGNRRTAINLGWEWFSLAVLYLLLRRSCRGLLRPVLVRAVAVIWIALAGYGIWQHVVWYPATLQSYEQAREKYDAALSSASAPNASASAQQALRQATVELTGGGVPLTGPARELFERRLRDSQEPLGFFALANSFAGCLAVVVVLLTVVLVRSLLSTGPSPLASHPPPTDGSPPTEAAFSSVASTRVVPQVAARPRRLIHWLIILLPLLLTTACLILTKSRTAWCGTFAGFALAAVLSFAGNRSATSLRRGVLIATGLLVVLGGLVGSAVLTGGLDPNVIREAPKSLKYRLEYWSGSLAVIAEHPLLGVGPGQFRDAYLKHKLPESSEEIADAHQALLDVWSNAGLPALLGLLGLFGFAGLNILQGSRSPGRDDQSVAAGTPRVERLTSGSPVSGGVSLPGPAAQVPSVADRSVDAELTGILAIVLAFGMVLSANFILEARIDSDALAVGTATIVSWWLLKPTFAALCLGGSHFTLPSGWSHGTSGKTTASLSGQQQALANQTLHVALSSGLVALLVHLQGAGGIAMPAVTGLLLLLVLLTDSSHGPARTDEDPSSATQPLRWAPETVWSAAAIMMAAASVTSSLTGFVPDQSRRSLLAAGDYEAAQGRAVPQAERLYYEAAQADVLSPEPWLRLSEIAFRQWSNTGSESDFDRGLEAARQAVGRSPRTASFKYHIGHWLLERAEREASIDLARQSVDWLDQAVIGYPTEPRWLATLALGWQAAGNNQQAVATAAKALDLDALNRDAGHVDRYLDQETLRRLAETVQRPVDRQ
jgi:O-antigen ligase